MKDIEYHIYKILNPNNKKFSVNPTAENITIFQNLNIQKTSNYRDPQFKK